MKTTTKTARFFAVNAEGERIEGAMSYEAVGTYARGRIVRVDVFDLDAEGERRPYDFDARPEQSNHGAAAWLALESGKTAISLEEAKARSAAAARARGWS